MNGPEDPAGLEKRLRALTPVTSVAPFASAPGIVVTSIDCLALVGQPMPQ